MFKFKREIKLFLFNSDEYKELRFDKIPRLVLEEYGREEVIKELPGNCGE